MKRHKDYRSRAVTNYKLKVATSQGEVSVPQLGGQLSLHGRDSKIHVTDLRLGGFNVLYSSAEIFSWKSSGNRTVLVVYGGEGEHHELAVSGSANATIVEGAGVKIGQKGGATILNWETTSSRRVVSVANSLFVYILGTSRHPPY